MSRPRVLRIIARMNVGGPALQVVGLTRGLEAFGFESRLLVGMVEPGEADYLDLRAPDVVATRIEGLGRSVRGSGDVRALRRIIREIRAFQPDIVHTHTAKAGALGRIAARICGVRHTVHTFHGHLLHGYFSAPVTSAVKLSEKTLARMTSRLVAVGSQVRDDLVSAGIGRFEQYAVVPPGVELPSFPEPVAARDAFGIDSDAEVVTYVARLTAIKRPERFIEVARIVAEQRPKSLFLVVGGGDLLDRVREQAAFLGSRVRFLGWRSDVETVYAASDLVVLTSDNEGMPVSLIEAATAGRPVVATRVGSVAEVVSDGETGLLTTTDPRDLAAAVCRLLDDKAVLEQMGRAAAVRAASMFGVERLVRDTADLYRSLLEESPTYPRREA